MTLGANSVQFEQAVIANSDAAYNLARWLVHSDQDAQDIVQEACVKAIGAYPSFRGEFRPWFLTIVRNTALTWLQRKKSAIARASGPEMAANIPADTDQFDPCIVAQRATDIAVVRSVIKQIPETLRETVVLREMEGLSYKEIAKIVGVPIGTVMSRLARGRTQLAAILSQTPGMQNTK